MHTTTDVQRFLIAAGYLASGEDDGIFGQKTLDAYNHWRASKGEPPVGPKQFTLTQVNADIWPDEQPAPKPASNPITDYLTELALKAVLTNLLKGLPIVNIISALSGYKTYFTGILMILIGAADWIGWAIPDTATPSPAAWIVGGLALCFGRAGLAKVVEDIVTRLGGGTPSA